MTQGVETPFISVILLAETTARDSSLQRVFGVCVKDSVRVVTNTLTPKYPHITRVANACSMCMCTQNTHT